MKRYHPNFRVPGMFSPRWFRTLLSYLDPVAYAVRRNRRTLRDRAGLVRRSVRLPNGLDVVYLDGGAADEDAADGAGARPPLVLLHGIGSNKDTWARLARRLKDRFRVIAPDLPGFGESSRPPDGDYDSHTQAENVRLFAEALGLDRFHLGGSSMGGRIAAVYAGAHPETLRSLWLMAPGGVRRGEHSEMLLRIGRGERVPLFARDAAEYAELLDFTMSQPPDVPVPAMRVLAGEMAPYHDLNMQVFETLFDEWRDGLSTEDALRGIPVPTLVLWGQQDRVLHPSGLDAVADGLETVTTHRLENVGHLPMLEVPEQAARAYLVFQDERVAAAAGEE